ncbi:histidinol-phosphate transaminase [Nocardioides sp. GY 10113]|uniref:histidinol-phosphate transaminase n=1 Tax=Nocardioides sp. GY 10113 TaxID=2569761 RepID=UPI0010A83998|nr:histidinol-phosphate transaminase [Nocardioides sp. GY 10113]TIC84991.1 histidinol-phosphate transaminase [Nocardioides sp. GY 10113]
MTSPQPLPHLSSLPPYVPGRPPTAPPGVTPYKLSSNENPYPPLPGVLEAAEQAVATMNRYPDMGSVALYRALADRLDVVPEQLSLGTGSTAVLFGLLTAFCGPGDEVVMPWRSFEAYPIAITVAGATPVPVPLTADARHDLAAMAAAVTERTKVVLLCTPNNPTGPALSATEVRGFLAAVPEHVLVVVDEAYLEFVRAEDPVDGIALVGERSNVAVVRTFSKAYGLAGLRVGYLASTPEIAAAVRSVALPFGVSTAAQAAAVASLQAETALRARVDLLVDERERLVKSLAEIGWQVPEAQGNFVWLGVGDRTAEIAAACDAVGLSVRAFAGEGVRITVGEAEANRRVVEVLSRLEP